MAKNVNAKKVAAVKVPSVDVQDVVVASTAVPTVPESVTITLSGAERAAQYNKVLSHPSRITMVSRLLQGPCTATELGIAANLKDQDRVANSRMLLKTGFAVRTREKTKQIYSLTDAGRAFAEAQASLWA